MPQDDMQDAVGKGIMLMGTAIVGVAMVVLFYIAQTVYMVLNDPEQVPVVKFLMEKIGDTDKGIYGNVDGKPYEVHLADPLRYMMYVIMGSMALGIMARVFGGLIGTGAGLLKTGAAMKPKASPNSQTPPMM